MNRTSNVTTPEVNGSAVWDGHDAYVIGGIGANGQYLDTISRFNGTWEAFENESVGVGATAVADGSMIYVFGGRIPVDGELVDANRILSYDTSTGAWSVMHASLPVGVSGIAATLDPITGTIWLFGGVTHSTPIGPRTGVGPSSVSGPSTASYLSDVLTYNPATDTIVDATATGAAGSLPWPMAGAQAVWIGTKPDGSYQPNGETIALVGGTSDSVTSARQQEGGQPVGQTIVGFDPSPGHHVWAVGMARLPNPVTNASAVWAPVGRGCPSGCLWVFGGDDGPDTTNPGIVGTQIVYCPLSVSNAYGPCVQDSHTLPSPHSEMGVALYGQTVWMFGGNGVTSALTAGPPSPLADVLSFSLQQDAPVFLAGSLPSARLGIASAQVGGNVFLLGGSGRRPVDQDNLEIAPMSSISFLNHPLDWRMPSPTAGASAAFVGGATWILGGVASSTSPASTNIWRLDDANGAITVAGSLPQGLAYAGTATDGHVLYLVGGETGAPGTLSNHIVAWDPSNGSAVTEPAPLPIGADQVAAAWADGAVWAFGGQTAAGASIQIVRFNPVEQTVTVIPTTLPWAIAGASAVADGPWIYLFGGSTDLGPSSAILRFDPVNGTIAVLRGSMPQARFGGAAFAAWGHLIYLGGATGRASLPTMAPQTLEFDPITDTTSQFPVVRHWESAATVAPLKIGDSFAFQLVFTPIPAGYTPCVLGRNPSIAVGVYAPALGLNLPLTNMGDGNAGVGVVVVNRTTMHANGGTGGPDGTFVVPAAGSAYWNGSTVAAVPRFDATTDGDPSRPTNAPLADVEVFADWVCDQNLTAQAGPLAVSVPLSSPSFVVLEQTTQHIHIPLDNTPPVVFVRSNYVSPPGWLPPGRNPNGPGWYSNAVPLFGGQAPAGPGQSIWFNITDCDRDFNPAFYVVRADFSSLNPDFRSPSTSPFQWQSSFQPFVGSLCDGAGWFLNLTVPVVYSAAGLHRFENTQGTETMYQGINITVTDAAHLPDGPSFGNPTSVLVAVNAIANVRPPMGPPVTLSVQGPRSIEVAQNATFEAWGTDVNGTSGPVLASWSFNCPTAGVQEFDQTGVFVSPKTVGACFANATVASANVSASAALDIVAGPAVAVAISGPDSVALQSNNSFDASQYDAFGNPSSTPIIWGATCPSGTAIFGSGILETGTVSGPCLLTANAGYARGFYNLSVLPGAPSGWMIRGPSEINVDEWACYRADETDMFGNDVGPQSDVTSPDTPVVSGACIQPDSAGAVRLYGLSGSPPPSRIIDVNASLPVVVAIESIPHEGEPGAAVVAVHFLDGVTAANAIVTLDVSPVVAGVVLPVKNSQSSLAGTDGSVTFTINGTDEAPGTYVVDATAVWGPNEGGNATGYDSTPPGPSALGAASLADPDIQTLRSFLLSPAVDFPGASAAQGVVGGPIAHAQGDLILQVDAHAEDPGAIYGNAIHLVQFATEQEVGRYDCGFVDPQTTPGGVVASVRSSSVVNGTPIGGMPDISTEPQLGPSNGPSPPTCQALSSAANQSSIPNASTNNMLARFLPILDHALDGSDPGSPPLLPNAARRGLESSLAHLAVGSSADALAGASNLAYPQSDLGANPGLNGSSPSCAAGIGSCDRVPGSQNVGRVEWYLENHLVGWCSVTGPNMEDAVCSRTSIPLAQGFSFTMVTQRSPSGCVTPLAQALWGCFEVTWNTALVSAQNKPLYANAEWALDVRAYLAQQPIAVGTPASSLEAPADGALTNVQADAPGWNEILVALQNPVTVSTDPSDTHVSNIRIDSVANGTMEASLNVSAPVSWAAYIEAPGSADYIPVGSGSSFQAMGHGRAGAPNYHFLNAFDQCLTADGIHREFGCALVTSTDASIVKMGWTPTDPTIGTYNLRIFMWDGNPGDWPGSAPTVTFNSSFSVST
ncbi:MAG: Kelch repeat-containing protein [Thermoplasmatota archaeon]